MITEDYCSFEVAKLLKEKGFDKFNTYGWDEQLFDKDHPRNFSIGFDNKEHWISCPSQSMAMKWLREVYGLHISLEPCYDYDSMHVVFLAFVQNVADVHEFFDGRKNVASYPNAEKSYELAIKYCLENLI